MIIKKLSKVIELEDLGLSLLMTAAQTEFTGHGKRN